MSSFTQALIVRKVSGTACDWLVETAFEYRVGALQSPVAIVVPAGFRTDGASVPRLLWWLWPPFGGRYDQAATLHDYLYRTKYQDLARVVADAIFLEAMAVLGVPPRTRWCIYLGVRVGGWVTYRRYRRGAACRSI
jgi:hypothetical protein